MKIYDTKICIIGGDNRQGYLAESLAKDGLNVIVNGLEKMPEINKARFVADISEAVKISDVIVLPVPTSKDDITVNAPYSYSSIYLSEILNAADSNKLILVGRINKSLHNSASEHNCKIIDYLKREELSVLNAIPTAEGALEIALRETKRTIFDSECLVIGYGRIGKILSNMLKALGAHVTASARKHSDLAWIKTNGLNGIKTDTIHGNIEKYDIIFNTVPYPVIGTRELISCKQNVVIIDLASDSGGVDFNTAKQCGIKTIHALSLPGKVAPISAAETIKETILNIIKEE